MEDVYGHVNEEIDLSKINSSKPKTLYLNLKALLIFVDFRSILNVWNNEIAV